MKKQFVGKIDHKDNIIELLREEFSIRILNPLVDRRRENDDKSIFIVDVQHEI